MADEIAPSDMTEAVGFVAQLRQGFPMTDIATMLMTSRTLVWHWLDGASQPGPADVTRILEIRDLLSRHFGDDLKTAFRVWRSKSRSGSSLGSMFSASFIDREAVKAQVELLSSSIASIRASEERRRKLPYKATAGRNGAIDDAPIATFYRE